MHPVGHRRRRQHRACRTRTSAQEAGWYDQGPTPGQYGPAVIVGHVDTTTGPAVFHGLKELRAGDEVEVTRGPTGSVAVFEVDSVERYDKERCRSTRSTATSAAPTCA